MFPRVGILVSGPGRSWGWAAEFTLGIFESGVSLCSCVIPGLLAMLPGVCSLDGGCAWDGGSAVRVFGLRLVLSCVTAAGEVPGILVSVWGVVD